MKIGDTVEVEDDGLEMLRRLMPEMPPNNIGKVAEIRQDGFVEVHFKLSGENHSQASLYPLDKVRVVNNT